MSVNRFQLHLLVIPEDRANEQIATGFVLHDQIRSRQIQVLPTADGWRGVLEKFRNEYIPYLRNYNNGHVVLVVDFDDNYQFRRADIDVEVPSDLKDRVFVIGANQTPELLRRALGKNFEDIGISLAEDCYKGSADVWSHVDLRHNDPDRQRLMQVARPILFGP